jgi:8-oxo-dGTP pyrophosphatase MutT (NUDIX family)
MGAVERHSAKVILVSTDDRVLLFKGRDPAASERGWFWFPPGGGVHAHETAREAARREVAEEVGLDLSDRELGPVVLRRKTSFSFEGATYEQDEVYFVVRVEHFDVATDGWSEQERRAISGHRWWHLQDLATTDETVFPEGLVELLQRGLPHP